MSTLASLPSPHELGTTAFERDVDRSQFVRGLVGAGQLERREGGPFARHGDEAHGRHVGRSLEWLALVEQQDLDAHHTRVGCSEREHRPGARLRQLLPRDGDRLRWRLLFPHVAVDDHLELYRRPRRRRKLRSRLVGGDVAMLGDGDADGEIQRPVRRQDRLHHGVAVQHTSDQSTWLGWLLNYLFCFLFLCYRSRHGRRGDERHRVATLRTHRAHVVSLRRRTAALVRASPSRRTRRATAQVAGRREPPRRTSGPRP